jgi:hypothetical protein
MDPDLLGRVAEAAGQGVDPLGRIERGYANNDRWRVRLADGSTAFAKCAVDDDTAEWLRREREVYELRAPFMPALLGWGEGDLPVLLLEDLAGCRWPPPWGPGDVEAALETLAEVAGTPVPAPLRGRLSMAQLALTGWAEIAEDPVPFLSLGLCDGAWLERALPALVAASDVEPFAGDALLHLDVRSDNLCLRGRAILVDWNWACAGNPLADVAFWLPSLMWEGGPAPEEVCPEAAVFAALVAGFYASVAGLPPLPHAPRVREVQRAQLRVALPWALRTLDLSEPSPRG